MKIFVCVKQVPAVEKIKIDPKTNCLIRKGIPSMINPMDKNAIELAVQLKETHNAETIGLTMGPPQAEEVLRQALAMGIDEAYLLTDSKFAGADTLATSYTLSLAIKKILKQKKVEEDYLIICGNQAIDGETGQTGPELAEELGIPQITYVENFQLQGKKAIIERSFISEEVVVIETKLPLLLSVVRDLNDPKYPTMAGIVNAYHKEITHWNATDLSADKKKIGLPGSRIIVWNLFSPERKGELTLLEGTPEKISKELCDYLQKDKVL
ncbi:MAG: Caffeyl-CoA reductase-Etf complex subunit CarD [Promethearchaeota archaeon]|nr:MAG: Caffeyl-CoA reductase-Etf complex subunit CarD [Candidatus Lokiarchaeota archaeon]